MTICIAAVCDNRKKIVLASDSMTSEKNTQFEQPTRKMEELAPGGPMVLLSGDPLDCMRLVASIRKRLSGKPIPSIEEVAEIAKDAFIQGRLDQVAERILRHRGIKDFGAFYEGQSKMTPAIAIHIQGQIDSYQRKAEALVCGFDSGGKAHIYKLCDRNNLAGEPNPYVPTHLRCNLEDYSETGFHAMGAGERPAHNALVIRGYSIAQSLNRALLIVYEAKKFAEIVSGVGKQTNISVMTPSGSCELNGAQLDRIKTVYVNWVDESAKLSTCLESLLGEQKLD